MSFKTGLLWTGAGAAALMLVACGGSNNTGPDGGVAGAACTVDTDCESGLLCHPLAKFCVKTCSTSADCPSTATNCAVYTNGSATTGSTKICQCTSDTMCGGGTGSSVICGAEDLVCEVKCSSSADCKGGRTCDTATGQCLTGSPCTVGSCSGSQVCDYNTGACAAAPTCNGANPQPDVCLNGEFCSTAASCADLTPPSCPNFTTSYHGQTWDPTNNAPIIYLTQTDSFGQNTTICPTIGTTWLAKIHVYAYWLGGSFPTTSTQMDTLLSYVNSGGTEQPATVSSTALTVTNGSTVSEADFHVFFCLTDNSTTFTGGLHFDVPSGGGTVSGNEQCFTAP